MIFSIGAVTKTGNSGVNSLSKTQEGGDFFVFNINNLYMPVDYQGVIADVDPADGIGPGGIFDNHVFLFSSGFFVSGETDGVVWGNGVLSASRIQDYQQGPFGSNKNDPKNIIYVVSQQDAAFGDSWQKWADAVSIGADFYDGDGDGLYTPIDKNGNGKWDADEDRPDLLGDVTAWCVLNDGIPSALRRFNVNPQGIEIHQTIFGFAAKSIIGNMMFVRYRVINTGAVTDTLENVYFSAGADPDLGDYADDLVGCDIERSAGYVYNEGSDAEFGDNPPSFFLDFFQGPVAAIPGETFTDTDGNGLYDDGIDIPLDTAFVKRGQVMGIDVLPGYKTLPLSSMTQYMQSHPTHGDPNTHLELRNYMLGGRGKEGDPLYISKWTFGNGAALGADTAGIDPKFMYSGDPETGTGWLNIEPIDQRIMCNTGPFNLPANEPQDIVVAYVIGRGENALNSVTVTKEIDDKAQAIFDNNFPSPPPPPNIAYSVSTGDGFIELSWPTADHVNYVSIDTVLLLEKKFEGFYVSAFKTNSKEPTKGGQINAKEAISWDLNNWVEDIYFISGENTFLARKKAANGLDSTLYGDPNTGRLRYRITADPFTGGPLVPGTEYYFAVGQYVVNHSAIVNKQTGNYGDPGEVIANGSGDYEEFESSLITVMYGDDLFAQAVADGVASGTGAASGEVKYLVVDKEALTGNDYEVEFFEDTESPFYSVYWRLKNATTNTVLIDSSKNFDFSDDVAGEAVDGMVVKVKEVVPSLYPVNEQEAAYETSADRKWFADFLRTSNLSGVFYVGSDISNAGYDADYDPISNPLFSSQRSTYTSASDLKRIELRFGETSKAYRYVNGFVGRVIGRRTTYVYAEGVTSETFDRSGQLGMFDAANDKGIGIVDVPFAAYVADEHFPGGERRLNVGFIERSAEAFYGSGNPDGMWDPGISIFKSIETIIIFNSDYDEGANQVYKGGWLDDAGEPVWADVVNGYTLPSTAGLSLDDSLKAVSPWFDALYTVNFQRDTTFDGVGNAFYQDGDVLAIEVEAYPYSTADKYTFKTVAKGELTTQQEEDLFDKVNVFPNPLYAYNPQTSRVVGQNPDDPFVTFTHIPEDATVRIYTLSGTLVRTLTSADKSPRGSQFLQWDLQNESSLRVASGLYLALIDSKKFGQKVLKFSIILPQKQLRRY
jgi:hypothetical protein